MKKKIIILAAVAVSGLAAVVASNVNIADAISSSECIGGLVESYPTWNGYKYWCCAPCDQHISCGIFYSDHLTFIDDAQSINLN